MIISYHAVIDMNQTLNLREKKRENVCVWGGGVEGAGV